MFTGLIEGQGQIRERVWAADGAGQRLTVSHPFGTAPEIGESIAVMGTCLTVVTADSEGFTADLHPATLARTTLGRLPPGAPVNLERAATPSSRLGGHLVQGHVDGVGTVLSLDDQDGGRRLRLSLPQEMTAYVVPRGSLAVDGVSLTVADLEGTTAAFALVPHTLSVTTLGCLGPGDAVNLEIDVIAKYVAHLLAPYREQGSETKEEIG